MKKNPGCLILINVWLIAAAICFAVFSAINKTGQSASTILFFSILLGAMIGFVAFCIMMIIGTTKIKKAKKYQAKQTETINLTDLSENHTISEKVSFDKPVEAYAASYVSEQQKKDALRIYNDSIDIIMKTSNMETYFSRYETAITAAYNLETYGAGSDYREKLLLQHDEYLCKFLDRWVNKCMSQMLGLKTINGKHKRLLKCLEELQSYYEDKFEFVIDEKYEEIYNYLKEQIEELAMLTEK